MMAERMMDQMGSTMMWGMGIFGILVLVLVVLAIAALGKYVFRSSEQGPANRTESDRTKSPNLSKE